MTNLGLHVLCSVKGGVGKSTLAVVAGKLLARLGRRPVVVDADMLGPSLADGLRLCAPIVPLTMDGLLDLDAPPTRRWYSVEETRVLRHQRNLRFGTDAFSARGSGPAPPFLNDALSYAVPDSSKDCSVASLLWQHESPDGVGYLPSSPLRADAARAAPFALGMSNEFRWVRRLVWVIDQLLNQRPDVTDIVLDLPPGTWGLSHEVLALCGALEKGAALPRGYPDWTSVRRFRVNPLLVMSQDRNDRVLAMDYLLYTRPVVRGLRPLCNRLHYGPQQFRELVKADLPAEIQRLGLEDLIAVVPELEGSLGRVFREGDLQLEAQDDLLDALRLMPFGVESPNEGESA